MVRDFVNFERVLIFGDTTCDDYKEVVKIFNAWLPEKEDDSGGIIQVEKLKPEKRKKWWQALEKITERKRKRDLGKKVYVFIGGKLVGGLKEV